LVDIGIDIGRGSGVGNKVNVVGDHAARPSLGHGRIVVGGAVALGASVVAASLPGSLWNVAGASHAGRLGDRRTPPHKGQRNDGLLLDGSRRIDGDERRIDGDDSGLLVGRVDGDVEKAGAVYLAGQAKVSALLGAPETVVVEVGGVHVHRWHGAEGTDHGTVTEFLAGHLAEVHAPAHLLEGAVGFFPFVVVSTEAFVVARRHGEGSEEESCYCADHHGVVCLSSFWMEG